MSKKRKRMRELINDRRDGPNEPEIGKTASAVAASRQKKAELFAIYNGRNNLPSSIMRADNSTRSINRGHVCDESGEARSYKETSPFVEVLKGGVNNEPLKSAYSISGKGAKAGALSIFPQNVGRTTVLLYTDKGSHIFDPFAGHNSRMELCVKLGRDYTGCDLSAAFMMHNRKRAKELRDEYPKRKITLHRVDSRTVPVESNSADFTITSPPYWDIEYYGDEPEQMGKCPTYEDFLASMKKVLAENFRILKSGSFAAYFINDFRRRKTMYFFHADILRLGVEVGFTPHDIMIVDLGRGFGDVFINQFVANRILPKRHEYGVIFVKL